MIEVQPYSSVGKMALEVYDHSVAPETDFKLQIIVTH